MLDVYMRVVELKLQSSLSIISLKFMWILNVTQTKISQE